MRKNILLVGVLLLISIAPRAQYVTIPDTAFVNYLTRNTFIGQNCLTGDQLDTNCLRLLGYTDDIWLSNNSTISSLEGIQYFNGMKSVSLLYTNVSYIPALPSSLEEFGSSYNAASYDLPPLPDGLQRLDLLRDGVKALPSILPKSLKRLVLSSVPLTGTHFPSLPDSLTDLYIEYMDLPFGLPTLPKSLKTLSCKESYLKVLPALPTGLNELDCTSNNLTSLPPLPDSLQTLTCFYNNLTSLPILPLHLQYINADVNPIAFIPPLPQSLVELNCWNCNLSELPALPDTIARVDVRKNVNLRCMNTFNKIGNLYLDNTAITCLPAYGNVKYCDKDIMAFPLCGMFNPAGCATLANVSGTVYADYNANCQYDNNDKDLDNIKVKLLKAGVLEQQTFTGKTGMYGFVLRDTGEYQLSIDTVGLPLGIYCPSNNTISGRRTDTDTLQHDQNFGLQCKPGHSQGIKSVVGGLYRPGTTTLTGIHAGDMSSLYGFYCSAGTSGTITAILSGPVSYIGPAQESLTPSQVNGNTITWDVSNFDSVSFNSSFRFKVAIDTLAQIGQQICIVASINSGGGDYDSSDNTLTQCFDVRSSYDPNDKQAYPNGNTDTATKWITYTLRFQNTGNDTAIHIYILDTLSQNVDASSFQLLASSHKGITQIYGDGIVKFNFPNIMLPDSNVNEELSHGYVQYKVKLKDNLSLGTQVFNTAYIYFDFNAPVVTNTTLNTITTEVATAVSSLSFGEGLGVKLFPNPATNQLTISSTGFTPQWITIYDVNGRRVAEQRYTSQLDVSDLTVGVYFIEVRSANATARTRFVKM